ncbi:MAG: murein biosynthesis integral membrane protein MurJ [Nitrococcus mobilis]|nr:murein biosynthesis integral membrane protein MurJ [Nitrococcus mobilis]
MRKGSLRSVITFGSLTFLSRVLGLVRDIVIGVIFGPSAATDAFFIAFKIPNFMRRLFAEGAFSQAFVPVLSEYRAQRSRAEVRQLVARTVSVLGMTLAAVTLLGVFGASWLVSVFAPGFSDDPERFQLAVEMLRLTFPYLALISLTACAGAVLNTYGSFGPPAVAPILLNLSMIAAAFWLAPHLEQGVVALAFAVLVAGVLQLLLQLPFVAHHRLLGLARPRWSDPGVRRILRLMGPALFGTSVQQINLLVDTILASFLVTGSISWLYWSDRLVEFPLGVFGVALGTVILPRLSQEHANQSAQSFSHTLDWALRLVVVLMLPASVGLALLAGPILATLFQYGAFTAEDVHLASLSLVAYALGLLGFALVKILAPGYFARQDTVTPVKCALAALVTNMVLSTSLVVMLIHTRVGHAGLAFATAIAAMVNAALLYRGLRRRGVFQPRAGWRELLRQAVLATLAMAGVLYWPGSHTGLWLQADLYQRVLMLAAAIAFGAITYLVALRLTGLRLSNLREPPLAKRQTA